MKRYVAVLTTVLLLALAAAAQTPPGAMASAHGACGPGQPAMGEAAGEDACPTPGGRRARGPRPQGSELFQQPGDGPGSGWRSRPAAEAIG